MILIKSNLINKLAWDEWTHAKNYINAFFHNLITFFMGNTEVLPVISFTLSFW